MAVLIATLEAEAGGSKPKDCLSYRVILRLFWETQRNPVSNRLNTCLECAKTLGSISRREREREREKDREREKEIRERWKEKERKREKEREGGRERKRGMEKEREGWGKEKERGKGGGRGGNSFHFGSYHGGILTCAHRYMVEKSVYDER